jgi:hypothetical protein
MFAGGITVMLFEPDSGLPLTGSGLFFGSLGLYLLFTGGIAELINRTGDADIVKLPLLTAVEIKPSGNAVPVENPSRKVAE